MKLRLSVLAALCAAFFTGVPPALADDPAAADTTAVHYYLSLGDSLAEGSQPNGDVDHGYADQLYALLKEADPTLRLVKLACGGETTTSMLVGSLPPAVGSSCGPPSFYQRTYPVGGTQLSQAVSFLHAHRQFVSLVTIDVGGDDLRPCVANLDFSSSCLSTILPTTTSNLATILGQLRAAAGPDVPIIGMNYYDPFLALWVLFPSPTGQLLAQASESFVVQFNDGEEAAYQAAGSPVAGVETAFSTTDFTLQPDGLPLNVERVCQWTWMCSIGDIHPNTIGFGVIAQAFEAVLP